ncbi:MAG TPA: MBG domain-containing protein [Acidimicrobiales bacterium]|nr:MBG domain-containing protein [Acidimicrobiales bacterium]
MHNSIKSRVGQKYRVYLVRAAAVSLLSVVGVPFLATQTSGAAQPTLLTLTASPNPAAAGAGVDFSATLSGGLGSPNQPTGDISMGAYTSPTCSDPTPAFTLDNSSVNGNGTYDLGTTVPPGPGTYYGGAFFADTDTFNDSSSTGSCMPIVVVDAQMTSLTMTASPNPAAAGAPVDFSATLSGGLASPDEPVGSISMGAYTTPNCSNTASFTLAANVDGNGTYDLGSTTPPAPGTYYGSAFFADTDGFNTNASTGSCSQILVVLGQQTTTTMTVTPNPAVYGQSVDFSATLSGGLASPDEPVGSISMGAYSTSNCSNTASFTLANNSVDGNGTYDLGSTVPPAVGNYYGEAFFADTDGFNLSSSSGSCDLIFTVTPAPLTVTAPTLTTPFGTIPVLTPTYATFVNGDTVASLTTPASCTTTATTHSSPGSYPITCSGAVDPNYTFTYVGGTLKIVKASTSFKVTDFLTVGKHGTTAVLGEVGLPANAQGFVFFQGPSNGCTIYLTGRPGEATTCFANFGTNVPYVIKGIFFDTDGNYNSSTSTNILTPHGF